MTRAEGSPQTTSRYDVVVGGHLGETILGASNGTTVFAAVNNLPWRYKSQGLTGISPAVPYNKGTGEVVAVDEATGKIVWDDKLPSSAYGAATIANNVVFTTTYNGTLYAFNASTGAELWHTALSSTTNAPVAVVARRSVVSPAQPGGTRRRVLGSNGLPRSEG